MEQEVRERRADEIEALEAFYGDDLQRSLRGDDDVTSSACCDDGAPPSGEAADDRAIPLEGPWFLRIRDANVDCDADNGKGSSLGSPTLEIRLPSCYPLGEECPEPILHNVMMQPQLKRQLLEELKDMHEAEMDVGIMWGERCREELASGEMSGMDDGDCAEENDANCTTDATPDGNDDTKAVRTFTPPTTRHSQSIRNFPVDVISNPTYERKIVRTPPFHPPKSGPAELMVAHVCSVTCMEHVQWALAELLFNDKKVAKATHNMFAYRFTNDDTLISDCDDDGEKGSGSKLAALLDMTGVENVLVVVSRWYGGVHLGPARFKWIAGVARDGLVQGGFLEGS
ncbi:hypothetical protein ACHAXT_002418 [Thalassiosira profunda]